MSAAARLFAERDYEKVLMADIAAEAGLAKGTVYLYFDTKEALFLELVTEQLSAWTTQLTDTLNRENPDSASIAAAFVTTLSERPVLVRLLALLHVVLERNIDADLMRNFKYQLLKLISPLGKALEDLLVLSPGQGKRVLLWAHAMIVGLAQMTHPSPVLEEVFRQEEALEIFRMDFRSELAASLAALFKGVSH